MTSGLVQILISVELRYHNLLVFRCIWVPVVDLLIREYRGSTRWLMFPLMLVRNKLLIKQSCCLRFEMQWRLCNIHVTNHDDVIKCEHFPRYWPFVRGIYQSPVNSPHKGQWCGALMFSLICAWINGWVNSREADDLRRHRAHYDVIVMG